MALPRITITCPRPGCHSTDTEEYRQPIPHTDDFADWVREHLERQAVQLEPDRLYTAQELEGAGIGIKAGTIRADQNRDRWPKPDDDDHGVNRWYGRTAAEAMAKRRRYRLPEK